MRVYRISGRARGRLLRAFDMSTDSASLWGDALNRRWIAATGLALALALGSEVVGGQMPTVRHSIIGSDRIPTWLATAPSVRLALPPGVRLELVTMSVISSDHRRQAALIGLFRNRGRILSGVRLTLAYIGPDDESVVRLLPNAAQVSEVAVDGLLPFRFQLLTAVEVPEAFARFEISLDERAGAARRSVSAVARGEFSTRAQRGSGMSVTGDVVTAEQAAAVSGAESPSPFLTLILWDKNDRLLDVLSGTAIFVPGLHVHRFSLDSFLPAAKLIKRIQVYAEEERHSSLPDR